VDTHFTQFAAQFTSQQTMSLSAFFYQAECHLVEQLKDYLKIDKNTTYRFFTLIEAARKTNNVDTNKDFWNALQAFNKVSFNPGKRNVQPWLRFVNIIERLQGYNGSQLFNEHNINRKRQHRLFFAYMLTWEHLRYIAGNEDDYSPSGELLGLYSDAHTEEDHEEVEPCCNDSACSIHTR